MVKLNEIRAFIDAYIKTNGNQEITGHTMNVLLNEIVRILDERKQDVLVSGENIKTINGESILGDGNIVIEGGGSYDDAELRKELAKKAEVHIIMNIDGFEDIIMEGNDDTPMRDADVDAILSGKLIAAESQINGYVLADEVYYEEPLNNTHMGFIVFHYEENEIKVVFDLTNKVYLGSESYKKAIAQKDYVDGKLTELSERIDNLPSGDSSVFEAIYEETTYAEIKEAYEAKKVVICYYERLAFRLSFLDSNGAYFTAHYEPITYEASCSASNNVWKYKPYNANHSIETLDNGNVKVTIANQSAEVATPQYVENLLGTIINGDY